LLSVEYRCYSIEFPRGRAASTLVRSVHLALALALAGVSACDRGLDRLVAPAAQAAPRAPVQTGIASYYARRLAGKPTASGKRYAPKALTAASRSLPLGSTAKVTNTENGRSVTVEVNDRGPYARNRILDVSPKAAKHLGFKSDGVAKVAVQPLRPPQQKP
jgi:rare lipoprotein A